MSFGDKKLSEIAVSVPGSTSLLREYDLDFCCGGSDTLANAAAEKGLNLAEIETRLTELQNSKAENPEEYWVNATYPEIIDHILVRYHQRHREQLQELIVLADRVESVHGDREDCPAQMPIRMMEMEHAEHGEHLDVLKSLTNNMTPPADACNTWRALYSGIQEFADDLMMHIHRENNILFPRVIAENP